MRILLIEDDSATSKTLQVMLKNEGFVCDTTDLGEDGLEIGKLYEYDLIILDEINVAMYYDLITKETLEFVLNQIPSDIEIVCTGRYAPQWLCERADLVTDMQEVKHYYQQGLQGRKGIEN